MLFLNGGIAVATMVLVEDESFERTSLKDCIDWNLIGVQIVGEAANGSQGLAKVMELQPDIVLADVKMPVMDGIEMSRRIRSFAPEIKILFVSSYDDFEYAKQAVNLNVFAYITKPINEAELLQTVKRAADEVTQKALEQKLYNRIQNNYRISMNLARQALVNRLLTGMPVNLEDAANMELEWLCTPGVHLCLLLSFYDAKKSRLIDSAMDVFNRKCSQMCGRCINVCLSAGVMITIVLFSGPAEEQAVESFKQLLKQLFAERGCDDVQIEFAYENDQPVGPAQLYDRILRDSAWPAPQTVVEGTEKKKSRQQIVEEIEAIIHEKYNMSLTIESIARMIHFTPNYIGTTFKTMRKMSIGRYLTQVRLQKAEELLLNPLMQIGDIAMMCGYENITYFHTIFKKERGITPSEYRQKLSTAVKL